MEIKKKCMSTIKRKLNNSMLVVCALILIICYFMTYRTDESTVTKQVEPSSVAHLQDGSTEYFFNLTDIGSDITGIMFYSSHQLVQGYYGGKMIYDFSNIGGFWGSTPGSCYNIIPINENMNSVVVKVTPVYSCVANQKIVFYMGAAHVMYDELIANSMPKFIASTLVMIFSLILFGYYHFMGKTQTLDKQFVHLAYFSFFLGVWTMSETDVATLTIHNRVLDSIIPYLCLMLVVSPFVLFFDSYLEINSKKLKKVIITLSMLEFVVLTVLHFTKLAEYRQTLPVIQLMLLVAIVYLVVGVIIQLVKKNFSRNIRVCAIGLSLFLIATVFDIYNYYKANGDADILGRFLFLIFVILLAWDMVKSSYEIIEKGRRIKQLEVFALTDSMTGLYNRNAFERKTSVDESVDGLTVIVADANGLKHCNDTFGHEAGDEYITLIAEVFNSVYGKYGDCFRTGGDEFCCLIPPSKKQDIERLNESFLSKISTINTEGCREYLVSAAIGSAVFDKSVDSDIKAVLKRADASMYENKRKIKNNKVC